MKPKVLTEKKVRKGLSKQSSLLERMLWAHNIPNRVLEAKILEKTVNLLIEIGPEVKAEDIKDQKEEIAAALAPPYGKVTIKTGNLVELEYLLPIGKRLKSLEGKSTKDHELPYTTSYSTKARSFVADVFDGLGLCALKASKMIRQGR